MQTLAKPDVTITQKGRWVKQGAIPDDPKPVTGRTADVVTHEVTRLPTTYATDGQVATEGKEWRIVLRPLNVTPAGQVRQSVAPDFTNPIQGQSPSRKVI